MDPAKRRMSTTQVSYTITPPTDDSGYLSKSELRLCFHRLHVPVIVGDFESYFDEMDLNKDGVISMPELQAYMKTRKDLRPKEDLRASQVTIINSKRSPIKGGRAARRPDWAERRTEETRLSWEERYLADFSRRHQWSMGVDDTRSMPMLRDDR